MALHWWHHNPFSHYKKFLTDLRGPLVDSASIILYDVTCSSLIETTTTASDDLEVECANNPHVTLQMETQCMSTSLKDLLLERKEAPGSWSILTAKTGKGDYAEVQEPSSATTKEKTLGSSTGMIHVDRLKSLVGALPFQHFENATQHSWDDDGPFLCTRVR
eukprot:1245187-Rhodomonas_salina.2